ncbi:MAG: lytic transglycosylase domain-containing protein, partial [Mycobacterium sp.]
MRVVAGQQRGACLALATVLLVAVGCAGSTPPATKVAGISSTPLPAAARSAATPMDESTSPPAGAQPQLAADPSQLADDLVADDQALHDPSTPDPALLSAARRQQATYRAIGHHPDWDALVRPRIPPALLEVY